MAASRFAKSTLRRDHTRNMNILAKWNPIREFENVQNRIASLFGRSSLLGDSESFTVSEWAPLVDVAEDEKEYLITAELPEVKREDVKVTAEDGMLRIAGERKFEKVENGKKFHRVERAYGTFERCFSIPDDTDAQKLTAEYKDGVLKVHLPKVPAQKPKAVEVKIS